MNDGLTNLPDLLLRTTLLLSAAAILVRGLLWLVRPHAPSVHRLAWMCVIAQGLLLVSWSIEIPWYEPVKRAGPEKSAR